MDSSDVEPKRTGCVLLLERQKTYLFGLFSFDIKVVDVRPELTEMQALQLFGHKYVYRLKLKFLFTVYDLAIYSSALKLLENEVDLVASARAYINEQPATLSNTEFEKLLEEYTQRRKDSAAFRDSILKTLHKDRQLLETYKI